MVLFNYLSPIIYVKDPPSKEGGFALAPEKGALFTTVLTAPALAPLPFLGA